MLNSECYALGANRSAIRDLFEYGRSRAAIVGEENVYDYSLGNPSIPSPKEVNETIHAILNDTDSLAVHGYTSAIGDFACRKAISDDLNARYGAETAPEDFFIGSGAAPELVSVIRALAVEGGELLAVAPYFPEYKPFAEANGLAFKVVPPDVPSFQIKLDAVEAMLTPATQAVIINSPNNPSGVVYTPETLTALGELLHRKAAEYGHPIYIISDEPYRELAYGVEVPFLPLIYSDTVVCYSYSKSLSLPGERIGYVYVPKSATDSKALYAAVAGAARACGHVCAPSLWQKVIAWRPTTATGSSFMKASLPLAMRWPSPTALSICLSRLPAAMPWLSLRRQSSRIYWWFPATALAAPATSGSATASART